MIRYLKKKEQEHIDIIDDLSIIIKSLIIADQVILRKRIAWHENELKYCRISIETFNEK